MITRINNPRDVIAFAKQLVEEGVNFHPDEDFRNYINIETSEPTYTEKEANMRNNLMTQCIATCEQNGIDVYDTMNEVLLLETGMDQIIPLPSTL
ncbi:MAG: hypothetical protein KF725_05735 [Cyclobacteriaceae bacterium]|nr:hypothetical protein [Cyclobacteriaceae bacterium]